MHWWHAMRWRIAGAYTLLLLSALALLALALLQVLRTTYLRTLDAGLAGQARLVAALAESQPSANLAHLRSLLHDLQPQLGARLTLIAADGRVLVDTLEGAPTADLSDRPEVRAALNGGQGAQERASVATGEDTYYVAVPLGPPQAPTGVARLGVPLRAIQESQARLSILVLLGALLAAALAVVVAVGIAQRLAQPISELRAMADRLAEGDLDARVPIPTVSELAVLAQGFNQMAGQLRRLLATVETERQRLATVLATMADGVVMLDRERHLTLVNQAAARLLALGDTHLPQGAEMLPLNVALEAAIQEVSQQAPPATPAIVEVVEPPRSGRSLRAVVARLPPPDDDQTLVLFQDLTDLRRAEQVRRTFLANLSHDLRTPLASLQAMLDTLQDGALDDRPAAIDFLQRMDAEVQSLNRLVSEFLELTRIESGQLALYPTPTDLGLVVRAAVARMQPQARQRRIDLVAQVAPGLPQVLIDGPRIEQALLNLVQNALTFTPAGEQIVVTAAVDAQELIVQVQDTGIGIPAEDLPHVFERFYKVDRSRSASGTGLGLAIVKHLVERHGGQVSAHSKPEQGTTITIRLPLTTSQEHE
jgi:two-component system phosphate regulon sensor histidine kinase PhoR